MANKFISVTRVGYFQRILNSLGGVIAGIIIFCGSFVLLYWNEGRQDLSLIARTAHEISATQLNQDASLDNSLVSLTGTITTSEKLSDDYLKSNDFIALKRKVEMYSWVETKNDRTQTETGGSQSTVTTYTYKEDWKEDVQSSANFSAKNGHVNPIKTIPSLTKKVSNAKVGVYSIDLETIELPSYTKIDLTNSNAILNGSTTGKKEVLNNNHIYYGAGTVETPQVGDIRISYEGVKANIEATVFGELSSTKIVKYTDKKNNSLYRLFEGTRDQAISKMHSEYVVIGWVLRIVGFLLMWLGLVMILGPLTTIVDILPIVGSIGKGLVAIITFFVALILSSVAIIISMLLHNVIALVLIGVLSVVGIIIFIMWAMKRKKITPASPSTQPPTTSV